ncbi:MAG: hypothetical protein O7D94_05060 [Planctomycetota bacterium]|nr:hypothetical protein [Planctomycetota bacterium]
MFVPPTPMPNATPMAKSFLLASSSRILVCIFGCPPAEAMNCSRSAGACV